MVDERPKVLLYGTDVLVDDVDGASHSLTADDGGASTSSQITPPLISFERQRHIHTIELRETHRDLKLTTGFPPNDYEQHQLKTDQPMNR